MIEIYKLKFTILQQEILRFLFMKVGMFFTERGLARALGVSPTAVSNALKGLERKELVRVEKDRETKRLSIALCLENPEVISLKRAENLSQIFSSELFSYLSESFSNATIILFGDFTFGLDVANSNINIALFFAGRRKLELKKFEKSLGKKIVVDFYDKFNRLDKNRLNEILSGIVLKGRVEL